MIVKSRVTNRPHAVNGGGGWNYIDGVVRVETHEVPLQEDGTRRAFTAEGLRAWVADSFGSERDYAFEVWPQDCTDDFYRYATIIVARLRDDRFALIVATDDCFLLGDNGQTVDRLY